MALFKFIIPPSVTTAQFNETIPKGTHGHVFSWNRNEDLYEQEVFPHITSRDIIIDDALHRDLTHILSIDSSALGTFVLNRIWPKSDEVRVICCTRPTNLTFWYLVLRQKESYYNGI